MKTKLSVRGSSHLLVWLLLLGASAAFVGPLAADEDESFDSIWADIEESDDADDADDAEAADAASGREAHMAKLKKSPKKMQAFRKRWDVDMDKAISEAEYARYSEWQEKREAIKPKYDLDGNGKVDRDLLPQFRREVKELNASYFKEGPKKKKKPGGQQ